MSAACRALDVFPVFTRAAAAAEIPHNVLVVDTAAYERQLFHDGARGTMQDPSGKPRARGSVLSLANLLASLGLNAQAVALHNAGNGAFLALLALQVLLDAEHTKVPALHSRAFQQTVVRNASRSPAAALGGGVPMVPGVGVGMGLASPMMPVYAMPVSPVLYSPLPHHTGTPPPNASPDGGGSNGLAEFGYSPGPGGSQSQSQRMRKTSGLAPADGRGSLPRRGSAGVDEAVARLGNMRV